MPKVRIGIDVGGTFTHAVAVNNETYEIIGKSMVPTTHKHAAGVAAGIVESLFKLLKESNISPSDVSFIAHSTTQATNALLEGDVDKVGIIGMGSGLEAVRAKGETKIENCSHRFYDTSNGIDEIEIEKLINELIEDGSKAIVAAEAFSVDNPENEQKVTALSTVPACGTNEISGLYGLKMRTRTSVVNASILPKMLEAANMTDKSIKEAKIESHLMIMRNDGGVMGIDEVKKRPIFTILSGPAAGVAAALMYAKISDGIFVEVGGTSTDISAIKDGRSSIKTAEVGGRKLFLKTLDVRTIGVAGGSLPKIKNGKVIDIGPRSAHILGLPYICFSNSDEITNPQLVELDGYSIIQSDNGKKYAFTTTCAQKLKQFGPITEKMSEDMLNIASKKINKIVEEFIRDYKFEKQNIMLVGGGGGAQILVPESARNLNMEFKIAENAPVISAIGAALALVSEFVERSIINPTEADILKIRQEAEAKIVKMGANPETVEVFVEVDKHKNIVSARAQGSTELRKRDLLIKEISAQERLKIASKAIQYAEVSLKGSTGSLDCYGAVVEKKGLFGLFKEFINPVVVIDAEGIIRFRRPDTNVLISKKTHVVENFKKIIEGFTNYGDAGMVMPESFVVFKNRIVNLSNLSDLPQMIAMIEFETKSILPEDPVLILTTKRN